MATRRVRSSPPPVWARRRTDSQSDAGYGARERSPTYGPRYLPPTYSERERHADRPKDRGYRSPPRDPRRRDRSPIHRRHSRERSPPHAYPSANSTQLPFDNEPSQYRDQYEDNHTRQSDSNSQLPFENDPSQYQEQYEDNRTTQSESNSQLPFENEPSQYQDHSEDSHTRQSDDSLPFQNYVPSKPDPDRYKYVYGEESHNPFAEDNVTHFGNFKKSTKMFHEASTDFDGELDEGPAEKYRNAALECETCGMQMNSIKALQNHFAGAKHRKELKRRGISTDLTGTKRPSVELSESVFIREDGAFHCALCGLTMDQEKLFRLHINGKKHQKKLKWLQGEAGGAQGGRFWCNVCNVFATDKAALDTHYAGKQHSKMLRRKGMLSHETDTTNTPPPVPPPPLPLIMEQPAPQPSRPPLSIGHFAELLIDQSPSHGATSSMHSKTGNQQDQSTSSSTGPKSDNLLGVSHILKTLAPPPPPPPPQVVWTKCVPCNLLLLSEAAIDEHTASEEHQESVRFCGLRQGDIFVPYESQQ